MPTRSRPRLAPACGAREILLTEALPVQCSRIRHPQWKRGLAALRFRVDHFGHVLDLVRAFHERMRGKDLFNQGRARTRDADDQDGFTAQLRVLWRRHVAGENAFDCLDAPVFAGGIPAHALASRRVRPTENLERLRMIALVLERLGETETEQFEIARRQSRARQRTLQAGRISRVEAGGVEVGQAKPAFRIARITAQHFAVTGEGRVDLADAGEDPGQ